MIYHTYNKEEFLKSFSKSEIYKKLQRQYQHLYSDSVDIDKKIFIPPHRSDLENNSIFLYSLFYYLEIIQEINPKTIADIGCGRNFIKEYIPNIIGFDQTSEADVFCYFDNKFINNNLEKFDAAVAVNSLHFISLIDFVDRIHDFGKIIKKGGRGFITFNFSRLLDSTQPHEFAKIFDLSHPVSINDYTSFIEKEITKVNYKILLSEILLHNETQLERYNSLKGTSWPEYKDCIYNNFTNVTNEIVNEVLNFNFSQFSKNDLDDPVNGNIRIVFEV